MACFHKEGCLFAEIFLMKKYYKDRFYDLNENIEN